MNSRMEKYENVSLDNMSRTKRNQQIYNSTDMSELSRIKTNTNVSVISNAPKEIDIEKIKNYINSMNDETEEKRKRVSLELPKEEEVVVERKEEKDYDINSVLARARGNREVDYEEDRHRKLNNTQIDILKSIKIKEEKLEEKDDDLTGPIDELNTEEKTIVDLIQNIQSNSKKEPKKDLFEDLMADNDNTVVMAPINEEVNKENLKEALIDITQNLESIKEPENDFTHEIKMETEALKKQKLEELEDEEDKTDNAPRITEIDKTFYTNSMSFNKKDFEGYDDEDEEGSGARIFTKIAIFLIVIMLIATIVLILNFVLDWNLF